VIPLLFWSAGSVGKGDGEETAVGEPVVVRLSGYGLKSMKLLVCAVRMATVPVIEVATLAPDVPTDVVVRGAKEGVKFPV